MGITIRQKSYINVAKNELTRSYVPWKRGFHDSAKIAFSGLKNEENLLNLNELPFNRLFPDSTEIEFSGHQVRVVYVLVVLSLEPVERSSVRVTSWYRDNKSGKV